MIRTICTGAGAMWTEQRLELFIWLGVIVANVAWLVYLVC